MRVDWVLLAISIGVGALLSYEIQSKRAIVRGADRWTIDWVEYRYRPGMFIFSIALQCIVVIMSFVTFVKGL